MYWPGGDGPHFRPVPAAPPPPRVMNGPFVSPPPLLPPPGHPPLLGPLQRPLMQQPPVMQQYAYPSPGSQPPLLVPPPISMRALLPSMHPSLPTMQSSLPSLQRPLPPPPVRPNMPPSLAPPRPLLQQPPPSMLAGFQSMQPSLPSVRSVAVPFQSPLVQVQPPMSFMPAIQPAPFLPPLPPSPPLENPPPPPPPSPPPQSPPLPRVEEPSLSVADLLPPEPPKPTDPEMLKNIDVLATFVVKNGPRFESMARARQAGDPKFAFLFESDAAPEAAIGHEFYKWKKQSLALELGLEVEIKKNNLVDAGAVSGHFSHSKDTPPLPGDTPVSPAMSDMDMEDDFIPSPVKEPMSQLEPGSLLNVKLCGPHELPTLEGLTVQKDAAVPVIECMDLEASLSSPEVIKGLHISSLLKADEQRLRDGSSGKFLNSDNDVHTILQRILNPSSENALLDSQNKSEDSETGRQERRIARLSRWESLPISRSNQAKKGMEDTGGPNGEKSSSPTYDNSINNLSADRIDTNGESNIESGKVAARSPVEENQETVTVDEFGRLMRKEAVESDSEDDTRPRKRRRGRSRSGSRSRSRGRSRSRSRNRNRSRSRSYSSGESRWKRQGFSRSPPRRKRWSRSRSRSPHWQRNDSRSPSRDRWGGVGRGERDWRGEREPYGRGRRGGRGSGPSVCFHYARGRCFRGSACRFLHPDRETGQDCDVQQLADAQVSGFKDVEPTTNRPWIGADPGFHSVHEGKDEYTANRTVSVRDRTDPSLAVDSIESEEGKIQVERPKPDMEARDISCDSASEKLKQAGETLAGEDLEIRGGVDEPERVEASQKMELLVELSRSENDESGLVKDNSNSRESLKAEERLRRDTDVNLKTNEESENKAIGQHIDPRKGVMSLKQHSVLVDEAMSVVEKDKANLLSDSKGLEIKAEKPDLLEVCDFEEITPRAPAEAAAGNSEVEGEADSLRLPLISGAPVQRGSLSPVPSSEVKVMHIASSSATNENLSSERPVLASRSLDPVHYPSPAGSQVPNLASTSASIRNPFPLSSPNSSQQLSIPYPPLHRTLHNHSSHGASLLPHHGSGDIKREQSLVRLQNHLPNFEMHHSEQFSSNYSMLPQLGNRPHSAKEAWESSASFSLPKEESTYSRLFDNNTRQYTHSGSSGNVLQNAYPMSNIKTSAASTHNSLPWNEKALAASRATNAERSHYSYTLTTIPPLPSLIKMPGGSNPPVSSEQYDPLSDSLDLSASGALKPSSKPSIDGRSVGAEFLENVSPGLGAEKATALASATDGDAANMNEAAADVGVVENVSPPGDWSPVQPGDAATTAHDHSKSKKSNRGLKLLRTAVADRVKVLLKPAWKEGRLSKDAFKTIAKKAVEKVTGNLPSHHIPKSQEKVDQFMAVSSTKISKLVQGYIDKYSKVQG